MKSKRIVFWFLLAVFATACLYWLVSVPYRPTQLYRFLPANTTFVSHHRLLAERWDEFLANPLARVVLASSGIDLNELGEWSGDPDTRFWLDKLLARDVVIAYSPSLGPGRQPAWVIAGWIGRESIRLRWLLQRNSFPGFEQIQRHAGGSYWLVDLDEPSNQHLSIGITEGMLVGVYSADPHAARHILDAYDGLAPRLMTPPEPGCGDEGTLDFGWFIAPDETGFDTRYTFSLDAIQPEGLRGTICMPHVSEWPVFSPTDIEIPARLFGGIPFVLLGTRPDALRALAFDYLPANARIVFDEIYDHHLDDFVLLAMSGRPYGGSIAGIGIPSLIGAWPVSEREAALQSTKQLLDRLNATMRMGLVSTESRVGRHSLYTIESTLRTPYAALRERERVAYAVVDGWFLLASHAGPLQLLLERYDGPESLIDADVGGWQRPLRRGRTAAYGYIDFRGGARAAHLALSAYSAKLLFENPRGSREARERISEARAWIDVLEPMGYAQLWLDHSDGMRKLGFALGEIAAGKETHDGK